MILIPYVIITLMVVILSMISTLHFVLGDVSNRKTKVIVGAINGLGIWAFTILTVDVDGYTPTYVMLIIWYMTLLLMELDTRKSSLIGMLHDLEGITC